MSREKISRVTNPDQMRSVVDRLFPAEEMSEEDLAYYHVLDQVIEVPEDESDEGYESALWRATAPTESRGYGMGGWNRWAGG